MPRPVLSALLFFAVAQCNLSPIGSNGPAMASADAFEVSRWALQLTNTNVSAIDASDTDLVIVDPTGLSREDLRRLKSQSDGSRRLVIAYLNISEAETYRGYWQSAWNRNPPAWVGAPNPNWPNHFYAAYWDPGWQRILFGSPDAALDQILALEFDGVFMDGVDKYLVWPDRREQSERDMFVLIDRIAEYGRSQNPGFLVIPNNAEGLLDNRAYRATIDAIVKEDMFYGVGGDGRRNNQDLVSWSTRQLRKAQNDGLPILVIEYVSAPGQRDTISKRLMDLGWLGTIGRRDLTRLTVPLQADDRTKSTVPRVNEGG